MKLNTYILLAAVVFSSACAPSSRKAQATVAVAGGAVAAAGALLYFNNREPDPSEENCPGYAPCGLGRELAAGTGQLLMLSGVLLIGTAALGALVTSAHEDQEQRAQAESLAALDPASCIEWQRQVEAERDPARRGALRAARPKHCAEPAPPGKVAAPVDRWAADQSPGGR